MTDFRYSLNAGNEAEAHSFTKDDFKKSANYLVNSYNNGFISERNFTLIMGGLISLHMETHLMPRLENKHSLKSCFNF